MNEGTPRPFRVRRFAAILVAAALAVLCTAAAGRAEDVLILGDARLKPVADVIAGIRQTLTAPARVCALGELGGSLDDVVRREGTRVVVALGREAIDAALRLPPSIPVIYDLTIVPPGRARRNTTGSYMATPVSEYLDLLRKYLPTLRRVAAIGSPELLAALGADRFPQLSAYPAADSFDLVTRLRSLNGTDALLLLPDTATLTPTALEELYLFSFRRKVPLLGIAEKHVKQGALLALVFDPTRVGRQIGELATAALAGADLARIPPSPARHFDLFLNTATARALGVTLPDELLKRARTVYP
ncbi:MAG: hypothetical protein HZB55_08470 [Deltaproteobacteria bacterium]|nr:hypothetical protein [Deltaproteobacteria bacterium]